MRHVGKYDVIEGQNIVIAYIIRGLRPEFKTLGGDC